MPGAFRRLNSNNISDLEVGLSRCATKKEIMVPYCTPFEGCFFYGAVPYWAESVRFGVGIECKSIGFRQF